MKMETCEFCGKQADIEGTSMTGGYCIDCLRLVRSECLEAIKLIQKRGKINPKHPINEEDYNKALNDLLGG